MIKPTSMKFEFMSWMLFSYLSMVFSISLLTQKLVSVIQNDARTDDNNQELEDYEMDNTLVQ